MARGLLPATVSHADAAANAGRAALLVAALGRQPELLLAATEDFLHQEHREPAMPRTLALVRSLRADGLPAVVSGAGPTVLVVHRRPGPGRGGRPGSRAAGGRSPWRSTGTARGSLCRNKIATRLCSDP